jgi:outer membrane protein assembly factor BamE (lipoprotein component of BamABCDE complex)
MMGHSEFVACLQTATTNETQQQNRIMKKTLAISLLVTATMFGLCGCASNQGGQQTQTAEAQQTKPAKPPKDKRPKEDRLKVGMTMDQVVAAIGKPKGKSVSSDGSEIWSYNDAEKGFIPNYALFGGKTHFLTVFFDTTGKVKSWSSSEHGMY